MENKVNFEEGMFTTQGGADSFSTNLAEAVIILNRKLEQKLITDDEYLDLIAEAKKYYEERSSKKS